MNLRNSTGSSIFLIYLFVSVNLSAQIKGDDGLTIGGYVEAYYSFDFNDPKNHYRPTSIYNYNRINEVNVNLAMIKLSQSYNNRIKTFREYTFRNVVRSIDTEGSIFTKGNELRNNNFAITSSLSLTF